MTWLSAMSDAGSHCVFCAIARGESAAHVVLVDAQTIAFLDRAPLFEGHCLLIPKSHVVTLPDLAAEDVSPLFTNAQRLCRAVERAMGAEGTFVAMNNTISQSVPHLHVHVVPRRKKDGLRGFFWPRLKYPDEERAAAVATSIQRALEEQGG